LIAQGILAEKERKGRKKGKERALQFLSLSHARASGGEKGEKRGEEGHKKNSYYPLFTQAPKGKGKKKKKKEKQHLTQWGNHEPTNGPDGRKKEGKKRGDQQSSLKKEKGAPITPATITHGVAGNEKKKKRKKKGRVTHP